MVGISVMGNPDLIKKLLSFHPNAIKSVQEFLVVVKPGDTLYSVHPMPGAGGCSLKKITFESWNKYEGEFECLKDTYQYKGKSDGLYEDDGFLNDILRSGSALFYKKKDAETYKRALSVNWSQLIKLA